MRRGEIWWAELPPPIGRRPVVLLSRETAYAVRTQLTVALVTTTIRDIPPEVPLGPDDGLQRQCVVNLDTITTIPKAALKQRVGALSLEKILAIEVAIHYALGLRV